MCIDTKSDTLHLTDMGLTELPRNIPHTIKKLYCSYNRLVNINNLPKNLEVLDIPSQSDITNDI